MQKIVFLFSTNQSNLYSIILKREMTRQTLFQSECKPRDGNNPNVPVTLQYAMCYFL